MAELADCPSVKLTLCLSIFVTPNATGEVFSFCSFSFHSQLSLGGIIVLQSQGRWALVALSTSLSGLAYRQRTVSIRMSEL